jgi:hypothetical protein
MSVWNKIRGTIETLFQLGLGGPNLKNNSGVIEARDAGDASYAIMRGATPVGANDLATKAYVDSGGGSGALQVIRYAIGTGATQDSTTQIPASARVFRCDVEIVTPYSGGATIEVGQPTALTAFQATADNLPTAAGTYSVQEDVTALGVANVVRTTVGGAPVAGAGFVCVFFSETLP